MSSSSPNNSEADSEDLEAVTPRKSKSNKVASGSNPGNSYPKYAPPKDMVALEVSSTFKSSPFEWEALASKPEIELWTIRVPKDIKPSRLSSLSISLGKQPTGSLKTKSHTYTLVAARSSRPVGAEVDNDGRQPTAGSGMVDPKSTDVDGNELDVLRLEGGAEMMGGMRLLVPKIKEGGKLFLTPKPVTRHFMLTPDTLAPHPAKADQPFLSTAVPNSTTTSTSIHPEKALPSKRAQPTHLLKFRNCAYGFDTPGPKHQAAELQSQLTAAADAPKEKKRKSLGKDQASPKKKKVKT